MQKIHPTAIIDPTAELAADVEVGPYSVIEGNVKIGSGTRLMSHAIIRQYTTLGAGNLVDSYAVLGGVPQDYKFDADSVTYLRIGDRNVFREGVTISRATGEGNATVVGNGTYWMTQSHAGHNATIEDGAILVNNVSVAGHATVGKNCVLSSGAAVHQFCWLGQGIMAQANAGATMHVPPFVMLAAGINNIVGLNSVGIARNKSITMEDRRQIKEAFALLYRNGLSPSRALERMDACSDWGSAAGDFRDFVRRALNAQKPFARGICHLRRKALRSGASACEPGCG